MKIYTRTGDKGQTGLLGGTRVSKSDVRIHAYGTIDELNSHLGMLRDLHPPCADVVISVQDKLFSIGSRLASSSEEEAARFKVPLITEEDVAHLEELMDRMDASLPPMRNFILPGGHPAVSQAHICRTVCRRAERLIVPLVAEGAAPDVIVRYLNRLSDLLFVLARNIGKELGVAETPWVPRA